MKILVFGTNYSTTLAVLRSLGKEGVHCDLIFVSDSQDSIDIVKNSKYLHDLLSFSHREENDIIESILKKYQSCKEKVILFPTSDYAESFIDNHYEQLQPHFLMPHIEGEKQGAINELMDKVIQNDLAESCGLDCAKEWSISLDVDNIKIPIDITFPCFVKPQISINGSKTEMKRCNDINELGKVLNKLQSKDRNRKILVQEYLEIDKEFIISGLCMNQEILVPALVQKMRVARQSTGLTIYGCIVPFDILGEWKIRYIDFLKKFKYTGIFDLEVFLCKDGRILFNEMNFRTSGVLYAITYAGENLPFQMIKALRNEKINSNNSIQYNVTFFNDKVAWTEYQFGYINRKEFNELKKQCDFSLMMNEEDSKPAKTFEKLMKKKVRKAQFKKIVRRLLKR